MSIAQSERELATRGPELDELIGLIPGSYWYITVQATPFSPPNRIEVEVGRIYKNTVHYLGPSTHKHYVVSRRTWFMEYQAERGVHPLDRSKPVNSEQEDTTAVDLLEPAPEAEPAREPMGYLDLKQVVAVMREGRNLGELDDVALQVYEGLGRTHWVSAPKALVDRFEALHRDWHREQLASVLVNLLQSNHDVEVELVEQALADLRSACRYSDTEVAAALLRAR